MVAVIQYFSFSHVTQLDLSQGSPLLPFDTRIHTSLRLVPTSLLLHYSLLLETHRALYRPISIHLVK